MIKVDQGAQSTDAFQECRNTLLSTDAHADAIPGLEILVWRASVRHMRALGHRDWR